VFLEEVPRRMSYSKKNYKQKQKKEHRYKAGTWNVCTPTLKHALQLENLKKKKNAVSFLCVSEVRCK
jgi:hypothetical protein